MKAQIIILSLFILVITASYFLVPQKINYKELMTSPQKHNGRDICVDGAYLGAFETSAFGEKIEFEEGRPRIKGEIIWVEGARLKKEDLKKGPGYVHGETTVCGQFETGSRFGHLGSYKHQLITTRWDTLMSLRTIFSKPNSEKAERIPNPTMEKVDITASFTIITGNITRSFKAEKYHNLSPDVYITSDDPTVIHVKKAGITWDDYFMTLPMKLTKQCLTTGDGETFCDGKNASLKFYLNDIEDKDLLDKEIKEGDKALIKF